MKKIKCMFSNYYEIANDRGIGAEIYIDFENVNAVRYNYIN